MKLASVIVILVSVVTIRYPVATQDLPAINPDNLDPGAAHVCQNTTKTESYTRQVAFTQYYIKKTYTWCVSIPPRCTENRLASRTSYRIETRYVDQENYFCCSGYRATECRHNVCVPEN